MILFSLIIPVYIKEERQEKLLNRLLNTIPDRDDLEIILCNDGSPNWAPIHNKFQKTTVIVKRQENKGAGAARNLGLKMAKGTWIFFADADDYFKTDMLEKQMATVKSETAQVVYFPLAVREDKQNQRLEPLITFQNHVQYPERGHFLEHYIPTCKFCQRRYLFDNNITFSSTAVANDLLFSVRLVLCKGKISWHDVGAYVLTTQPNSLDTQSSFEHQKTRILVKHQANTLIKKEADNPNWLRRRAPLYKSLLQITRDHPISGHIFALSFLLQRPYLGLRNSLASKIRKSLKRLDNKHKS